MAAPHLDFDDVLRHVGQFGAYQRLQYGLMCVVAVTTAFHWMNMVFVGPTPNHRCTVGHPPEGWQNLTDDLRTQIAYPRAADGEASSCRMYNLTGLDLTAGNLTALVGANRSETACVDGWTYDTTVYTSTIVSEWDLVCDDAWQQSAAQTVFFAGRIVGALFSLLSDRYGRRPVFFISVVLQAVSGGAAAYAPTLPLFYCLYFLQGTFQMAVQSASYVLGMEAVGPSYRKLAGLSFTLFDALGQMVLSGMAYGLREWRFIELTISLSSLLLISFFRIMPESIRWLVSVKRKDEAFKLLQKVSKMNNVSIEEDIIDKIKIEEEADAKKYTVIDIFRRKKLAKIALNVWFNWMATSLVYYGVSLNSPNLAGNPYVNACLSAVAELPSLLIAIFLLDCIGRKKMYIFGLSIAALGCLPLAFIPKDEVWLATTFAMVGKLGIAAAYGTINLISAEVFPTVVRNNGMGIASVFARVGGMVAPQVVFLRTVSEILPNVTFTVFALLGIVTAVFLPETAGQHLADNMRDAVVTERNAVGIRRSREVEPVKLELQDEVIHQYM